MSLAPSIGVANAAKDAASAAKDAASAAKDAKKKEAAEPVKAEKPPVKPVSIAPAKEALANGEYHKAVARAWKSLKTAKPGGEAEEQARYVVGAGLEHSGFDYAAAYYYHLVAISRQAPELLPHAIRGLERIVRRLPAEDPALLVDLLGGSELGSLPAELADFVYYWQGLFNLRQGLDRWANERFARVSRAGYYAFATLYANSVRLLAPGNDKAHRLAVECFARRFGPTELHSALESLRRRGESDSRLLLTLKALIDEDGKVQVRYEALPKGWRIELAMLGFARVAAESGVLLQRSKETDEEELGRLFSYRVEIGGIPIYTRAPRFEDRAPLIKAVAKNSDDVRRIRGMALHSLGRLLFERKRFAAAYDTLGQIPSGTEPPADVLLERAWSKFKAGDPHRAMGLVFALDAPAFRDLFAPERYVLRGLIFRRFCHYRAARLAARRFFADYGKALARLRAGRPVAKIAQVRRAVLARGRGSELYRFVLRAERERSRIDQAQFKDWPKSARKHISSIYGRKLRVLKRELERVVDARSKIVAEEMLAVEEQANLLEYEVGQAIFQRLNDSGSWRGRRKAPKVPVSSRRTYYRFDGEYWTDELPSYKFNIDDRCVK